MDTRKGKPVVRIEAIRQRVCSTRVGSWKFHGKAVQSTDDNAYEERTEDKDGSR